MVAAAAAVIVANLATAAVAGGADVEVCLGQAGILSQRSKLGQTFLDPRGIIARTAGSIGGSKVAS